MKDGPTADEKAERKEFFEQAAGFTQILSADDVRGARFLVRTGDGTVGRGLFWKGGRGEFTVLEAAMDVLSALDLSDRVAGRTFLDIGANIGTSSIAALLWHGFHDAVACEPEPSNYELLKLNAVLNHVDDRLRALPVAVSSASGTSTLFLTPDNSGGHSVRIAKGSFKSQIADYGPTIKVERVSLNELVARELIEPERAGLLWVDVQGHEAQVLKGATALLDRDVPAVIEYYPAMLDRVGQLRILNRHVAANFTHFVDLRDYRPGQDDWFELLTPRALPEHASTFDGGRRFTDLLLLRLPSR
jgi:FkbM family methyltransferase